MPHYIVKFEKDGVAKYLEWSTVVDAPVTFGVELEHFKRWYLETHGTNSARELAERLERVERFGTSSIPETSTASLTKYNRAGPREQCATLEQLWEMFCSSDSEIRGIR